MQGSTPLPKKMVAKNKAGLFTGKKENNTSWTFSLTAIQ